MQLSQYSRGHKLKCLQVPRMEGNKMKWAGDAVRNTIGSGGDCGKLKNTHLPYLMVAATVQLQVTATMQKHRVSVVR